MKSKEERHQPICMVAHQMIGKLGAIIGNCDLFFEETEPDTPSAKHIRVIREIAQTAVKELVDHQQQVESAMQKSHGRKAS